MLKKLLTCGLAALLLAAGGVASAFLVTNEAQAQPSAGERSATFYWNHYGGNPYQTVRNWKEAKALILSRRGTYAMNAEGISRSCQAQVRLAASQDNYKRGRLWMGRRFAAMIYGRGVVVRDVVFNDRRHAGAPTWEITVQCGGGTLVVTIPGCGNITYNFYPKKKATPRPKPKPPTKTTTTTQTVTTTTPGPTTTLPPTTTTVTTTTTPARQVSASLCCLQQLRPTETGRICVTPSGFVDPVAQLSITFTARSMIEPHPTAYNRPEGAACVRMTAPSSGGFTDTVRVTVRDSQGHTASAERQVQVH